MNISCCIITCSAGMAQKLWKPNEATSVNSASASAAQRVPQPRISAIGAITSTAMATMVASCGIGSPTDAM